MDLKHSFTVPASLEETWKAFNDLESVAPCFPGATLTSVEGDEFTGTVKIKLGPISMVYNGSGEFVERDDSKHHAVIEAKGKDKRGNGTAGAKVSVQLKEGTNGTDVVVDTDLSITGKPAQFGRGVIQDVSDKLLGQFVECIADKLGSSQAGETPPAEPAVSTPSTGSTGVGDSSGATRAQPPGGSPQAQTPGPPQNSEPQGASATRHTPPAELDMMSTVLPVLIKRYALPVAAAILVLLVIRRIVKR